MFRRLRFRPMSSSSLLPETRPLNWKSLAPPIPNFAAQQSALPRLPVPPLAKTLDRLKTSLRPLARSVDEYDAVAKKIDEFGMQGGVGRALQDKLEERQRNTVHWLEEWWDDYSYLAYRDSVCLYFYPLSPYSDSSAGGSICIVLLCVLYSYCLLALTPPYQMVSNHSLPISLKRPLPGQQRSPAPRCSLDKSFALVNYLQKGFATLPSAWIHTGTCIYALLAPRSRSTKDGCSTAVAFPAFPPTGPSPTLAFQTQMRTLVMSSWYERIVFGHSRPRWEESCWACENSSSSCSLYRSLRLSDNPIGSFNIYMTTAMENTPPLEL